MLPRAFFSFTLCASVGVEVCVCVPVTAYVSIAPLLTMMIEWCARHQINCPPPRALKDLE
jgi:hypothetical protein